MSLTIGQLAKLTGLTVRALHHYDAIGLLTPSQRSDAGYRLYTQHDVARLFRIQALQSLGLTLTEVGAALDRDGAQLTELIDQQLAAVNEQLEHTLALRLRLTQLNDLLRKGDEPATGDWIAAVELITQYSKYCSPEELKRLIAHRNDSDAAWRDLIDDWRYALENRLAPTSTVAQSLLTRWSEQFLSRVGGDMTLAAKMKAAYAHDSAIRHRMEAQTGITPSMLEYLGEAMLHAHRLAWAKHLHAHEVERLQLQGDWQKKLMSTLAALAQSANSESDRTSWDAAFKQWRELLDYVSDNDVALRAKVQAALLSDIKLARLWLMPDIVRNALRTKDAARSTDRLQ
jgi:DNA-binding transcriptional MerR regulator